MINKTPTMPRLIVHSYTISLDGYGAGPQQSLEARSASSLTSHTMINEY